MNSRLIDFPHRLLRTLRSWGWLLVLVFSVSLTHGQSTKGIAPAGTPVDPDSGQRWALVIGNANYDTSPLRNPINDARAIAQVLETLNFQVTLLENASQRDMKKAIDRFGQALQEGGTGLFYYSGHGVQVGGRNYLVPVGASIVSEPDVEYEAVDAGRILAKMEAARNEMNLVILDACRNNPFASQFRTANQGLATLNAPAGTFISYATAPGSVASDGEGQNGLYTGELVQHMSTPGLKLEEVFKRVRSGVQAKSNGAQIPWDASSLTGDFYFLPAEVAAPEPPVVAQAAPAAPAAPAPSRYRPDEEAWEIVKESDNPTDLQFFINQFPESPLRQTAQLKMRILQSKEDQRQKEADQKLQEAERRQREAAEKLAEAERRQREAEERLTSQQQAPARPQVTGPPPLKPGERHMYVPPEFFDQVIEYRGHTYALTRYRYSFDAAESLAQRFGGHLVRIDDRGENRMLFKEYQRVHRDHAVWLGFSDQEEEGTFRWTDGSESALFDFRAWGKGQPDNWQRREDCVEMRFRSWDPQSMPLGGWNDAPCTGQMRAFVEWSGTDLPRTLEGAHQQPMLPVAQEPGNGFSPGWKLSALLVTLGTTVASLNQASAYNDLANQNSSLKQQYASTYDSDEREALETQYASNQEQMKSLSSSIQTLDTVSVIGALALAYMYFSEDESPARLVGQRSWAQPEWRLSQSPNHWKTEWTWHF